MAKAIIVLAHGSREGDTEKTMEEIVSHLRDLVSGIEICEAYMQFRENTLLSAMGSLAKRGFEEILIIPYFLFEGVHIKHDIPMEIAAFERDNPDIKVKLGRTLGSDSRLASVLADRAMELIIESA